MHFIFHVTVEIFLIFMLHLSLKQKKTTANAWQTLLFWLFFGVSCRMPFTFDHNFQIWKIIIIILWGVERSFMFLVLRRQEGLCDPRRRDERSEAMEKGRGAEEHMRCLSLDSPQNKKYETKNRKVNSQLFLMGITGYDYYIKRKWTRQPYWVAYSGVCNRNVGNK